MNYKINNTLFMRKHHYVNILKESEILRHQMNEELADGMISAHRIDEINQMFSLAFAGLLQEGLEFRYARDTDASKESLVMTIDHIDYRCRVNSLRNVLGDKLSVYLSETQTERRFLGESAPSVSEPVSDTSVSYTGSVAEKEMPAVKKEPAEELPKEPEKAAWPFGRMSFGAKEETSMKEPLKEQPLENLEEDPEDQKSSALFASLFQSLLNEEEDEEDEDDEEELAEDAMPSILQALAKEEASADKEETYAEQPVTAVPETADAVTESPVTEEPESLEPAVSLSDWELDIEEKEKAKHTFCYQTHRIMVARGTTGNAENALGETNEKGYLGEEIYFVVAPCTMERSGDYVVNVPIVAYALYNGRPYYAGSFDNENPDQRMVHMSVGDYEFMVRGVFKNYEFESQIFTTGTTAAQDITLNPIDTYKSNPEPAKVRNGHLHFNYPGADEGETGTINIYPVATNKNSFVVHQKIDHPTKGVFEYKFCTEENRKILLQTNEGLRELICYWDGDVAKVDMIPA